MNERGKNGVSLPRLDYSAAGSGNRSGILERLYQIEPVRIVVYFDDDVEPVVDLRTNRSSLLLETLKRANLSRGVVVRFDITGAPVAPQALARLNAFLQTPGFSKGFRGWRRELEAQDAGVVLWKSAAAWSDLLGIIGANQS